MKALRSTGAWFAIVIVAAAVLLAGGIGYVIGHDSGGSEGTASTGAVSGQIPQTHEGENLPVDAIGDPSKGEQLFTSKGCSSCHSYAGNGGEDAPALDFMQGHLSAQEIADMSGVIWNHVPAMIPHFKEEGIKFPTFTDNQMADLLAYLHGGPPGGSNQGATTTDTSGDTTTSEADGEQLFSSTCGSCHTLAAAGTSGTTGPNLDDLKPSEETVLNTIQNPPPGMPSGLLSGADAEAVAKYVAQNAGQ